MEDIHNETDLEIGIPRQVISLKSSSRSLRLFSCILFLHNIIFIKGILLILFFFEEFIGYLSVQFFSPSCIIYYFFISIMSLVYRMYTLSNFLFVNTQYVTVYILSFLIFKSFFILHLFIFRDRLLQLDRNSLLMIRNIRYI